MDGERTAGEAGGTQEIELVFRSLVEWEPGPGIGAAFASAWPDYRRWYLRDGEAARSSYAECESALRTHVPELVPAYERLVDLAGGGDLEARFLSLWNPPPVVAACSVAAWLAPGEAPGLLRTYDYVPALCDTTLLASAWAGGRVLAMTDCIWGVLDGVNEHGLAVALSFGGRQATGPGFSVTLIQRYALELCRDTAEAVEAIRSLPVNLSYNVAVVDRAGDAAVVRIAPDREAVVVREPFCANRQGQTEWPEHAEMCGTVEREAAMAALLADPATTRASLESAFLASPLQRPAADTPWGTVYTASYDTGEPSVRLLWPGAEHAVSLADPRDAEWRRPLTVLAPPTAPPVAHAPGSAQMIFA